MDIRIVGGGNAMMKRAKAILKRKIEERTAPVGGHTHHPKTIEGKVALTLDASMPPESFEIVRASEKRVTVKGGDAPGVIYGCGELLRRSKIDGDGVAFGESLPLQTPAKPDRGMYFAVHNYNTYQVAPPEFLERYIEELALWGINDIAVAFHKFHFTGIDTPEAREYVEQLNVIFRAAHAVGMKTTALIVANDGYLGSPEALRYKGDVARNWGAELCPADPKGLAIIRREFEEIVDALAPLDQVVIWPYDSGGCHCEKCRPWGKKGYIELAKDLAGVFKKRVPNGKYILSTWYFDYNMGDTGEWDNFFELQKRGELDWIDGILADGAWVNDFFPKQVIEREVEKPILSFLEISMVTGSPWGGFGSNPIPKFIQSQWALQKDRVIGGVPYSEGIYEDINKVLWARLCWSPERSTMDILEEYVAYEFSREHSKAIAAALSEMEPARMNSKKGTQKNFGDAEKVWETLSYYDRQLSWRARTSWRWRQTLLRAQIDAEMARHGEANPTPELGRAYDELFRMYYLDDRAFCYIRPFDVIPDGPPETRKLKAIQRGKSLLDFCDYRKKQHEDTGDSVKK